MTHKSENDLHITVVIPTHSRSALLRESLAAALGQTRLPQQVVVVSDIDDPDTQDVVSAASTNSANVPVVYEVRADEKPGASASRNRGAERAPDAGFIAFLDDDDLWEPTYLERVAATIAENDKASLIATWMTEFSEKHSRDFHTIPAGLQASEVLAINPGITGSSMVVAAEAFRSIGGFDPELPVKNDTDFFARFLLAGFSYAVVQERLVKQRQHGSAQLTGVTLARARGTEIYLAKHRDILSRKDRRLLRQSIHRIRSRASESAFTRLYHLVWTGVLYGPRGLLRKVIQGRESNTNTSGAKSA